MNQENILNNAGTKYKTNVAYLIPKQHSQLTLNRTSPLTNFSLPRRILSSAAIHSSINYIDLNPYINHKWKCFLHPRNFPIKRATNGHRHHTYRGEWHSAASHESRFQRINDVQHLYPSRQTRRQHTIIMAYGDVAIAHRATPSIDHLGQLCFL